MSVSSLLLVAALAASGGSTRSARLIPELAPPRVSTFAQSSSSTYTFKENRPTHASPVLIAALLGGGLILTGAGSWTAAYLMDRDLASGSAGGIDSRAALDTRFLVIRGLEIGGYVAAGLGVASLGYALFLGTRPQPKATAPRVGLTPLPGGGAYASIQGVFP